MLRRGEVGCGALNDHGNYIIDHGKIMENHGILFLNFCGNPVLPFNVTKNISSES